MPLITNPDGSHRFVQGPTPTSSFDIESLVQARQRPSVGQPLRPPEWTIEPLPGYPGVSYFQLVLGGEGRGVYRQRGTFDQALNDYGEQDLVYDDYEVARLPFRIGTEPRLNNDLGGRLCGAFFRGRSLVNTAGHELGGTMQLYEDIGTGYEADMAVVAGFTPQAGAIAATCMKTGQVNGDPALFIGYIGAGTGSYTLAVYSSVTGAPAPVISNTGPTWGVCQTPVDGDSLQIYMYDVPTNTTMIKMVNTNVGLGSATYRDGVLLPSGGYSVGLVNLDGNPEAFYVTSANGEALLLGALPSGTPGGGYNPPAFRGKLMRVDLRALTIYPVAVALSFVLYATAGDNNDNTGAHDIFYCDGTDHQYLVRGADIPILPSADRPPPPPNFRRYCGGHWYKNGRFYWEENLVDTTAASPTRLRRYEFDPALGRYGVRPVSRVVVSSVYGLIASMGGPNQPWSPTNGNLISSSRHEWWWQYQAPRSETGYSLRHQDGASATSGPAYESEGYRRWPRLRAPGRPGAVMAISRVTGPPPANLRTGSGTDASGDWHNTFVVLREANTDSFALFFGDDGVDPDGRSRWRPAVDYPDNDAWSDELDFTLTAYRDSVSGAMHHLYTPNPGPIVVEGYLREIGAPPPSRHILNWAADRMAADDLSRPLL